MCLGLLAACKPTEKNYKAAYDVAVQKRQQESSDASLRSEGHRLITDMAPRTINAAGRDWNYIVMAMAPDNSTASDAKIPAAPSKAGTDKKPELSKKPQPATATAPTSVESSPEAGKWIVAVSRFRMPTNARSQVADLRSEGFEKAGVMKDASGQYYAVAGCFATLEQAGACAQKLTETFADAAFVGLDAAPLIIENIRR